MSSNAAEIQEIAPITACTISRDIQNFDLLIEDMEAELGEAWGDLNFADAVLFLEQPDAANLEFVAIAMDEDDESNIATIAQLTKEAVAKGISVIVIAEEVGPMALHQLLKLGAREFVPYPLPEGALHDAIDRVRNTEPEPEVAPHSPAPRASGTDRDGVILPVMGLSGGVGATTFAVNLAFELATIEKSNPPKVCLLDLEFQYGSVATYLDLTRRESVLEMLSDTESMDDESFLQALQGFNDKLQVLTAPFDMIPMDMVNGEDIHRILDLARRNFDYVVIDMPNTIVQWTETVLNDAHVFFALLELDMRSAQNALRLLRALKSEELPFEKMRYILNRAPKFTDMNGKSRIKRMAESLDISIEVMLPDGGKQVMQSCDHGLPLAETAKKNALRKEIAKIAASAHELNREAAQRD